MERPYHRYDRWWRTKLFQHSVEYWSPDAVEGLLHIGEAKEASCRVLKTLLHH
jgi:hypothetical protein